MHESLAFTRENRVFRFYMVGIAAFRLVIACLQTEVYLLDDPYLYIARRRISSPRRFRLDDSVRR